MYVEEAMEKTFSTSSAVDAVFVGVDGINVTKEEPPASSRTCCVRGM
jgi:hypothetical protein